MLEIIQGDALQAIRTFGSGMFDAVITDPPYSSGGGYDIRKATFNVGEVHQYKRQVSLS